MWAYCEYATTFDERVVGWRESLLVPEMTKTSDSQLQRVIDRVALPGILFGHRVISPGDEFSLLPGEMDSFAKVVARSRRSSGAARMVARKLFQQLGRGPDAIPKAVTGAPIWPKGLVGSLAHDEEIAVAAIAERHDFPSLGIDVEPAEPLDAELFDMVATPTERRRISNDGVVGRLLFSAKEAVYKAVHPLDGAVLDHQDIEVWLDAGIAQVRNGRSVKVRFGYGTHIVVLAFPPPER